MILGAGAIATTTARAQDAADTPQTAAVTGDDIIVTATRQATLLSKTPIAMTAIGGDKLLEQGVSNPTQLTDQVPNVSIVRGAGMQITIRGVTSTDSTEKGDPSAAFMVNGVYLARPQSMEVSFFDIARVEVLRGPQGTLYGRNTTAGLINAITTRPEPTFEVRGDASYQSYNGLNVTGIVNAPLTDTLAVRVAANLDRYDSYVTNTSGDGYSTDPFKNNQSVRLSALYTPTEAISLLVVGDYSKQKGTRIGGVPTLNFYPDAAPLTDTSATEPARAYQHTGGASSKDLRSTPYAQLWKPFVNDDDKGVMADLSIGLGDFSVAYVGSYRETNRDEHSTILAGLNRATYDGHFWQTSQELRLAYDHGPLKVQVGGYYFKEKSGIAFFILDPQDLGFPDDAAQYGFPQDPTIAVNKSVFGQATYEILPDLRLTAGARYSHDDKSRVGQTVYDTTDGDRVVLQINNAERSFSKVTWRAGVDYDSPVGLIYASVATGYKAGGFNDGCIAAEGASSLCVYTADELYYKPETLTAYELGVKLHTADNALRVNASLFHYDYNGLQLSQVGDFGGCGYCQLTTNAGKAKVDGVELEGFLRPSSNLQVELGFNWLNARYDEYYPSKVVGDEEVVLDFHDHPLDRSPRVSGRVGATWTIALGDHGELNANATLNYSAKYTMTDLANLIDFIQPAYTKTDLALTWSAPENRFYIGAYVYNLENKVVITAAGYGNFGADGGVTFMDPRRFGVRGGFKF
ncbi:TonB-dependent receptor [Novosphingobium sp. 1949]|uniref:TonB-dependent receptor n=1 Tax=Novosphingobium organovorum TaxID=2930092 RepID=A0ABT0BIC5_9SPHN|nr:TonB-dependent receptor [Novosphingobium organovorum]MCJ2184790.1 TonB-dependent receptor [Novosphingobium organovorum]